QTASLSAGKQHRQSADRQFPQQLKVFAAPPSRRLGACPERSRRGGRPRLPPRLQETSVPFTLRSRTHVVNRALHPSLPRSFLQQSLLEFLLALDAVARPRHSLQALGINFLAAMDALAE